MGPEGIAAALMADVSASGALPRSHGHRQAASGEVLQLHRNRIPGEQAACRDWAACRM